MQYTANGFENILNEFRGALERGEELLPNSARQHGKTFSFQTLVTEKKVKHVSELPKEEKHDDVVVTPVTEEKPKKAKKKKKDSE